MLVMAMVQIEQKAAVVNCTRQTAMPGNEVRQTGTAPSQLSMDEVLLFRRGRASPRQCNQLGGVVELEAEDLLFLKKSQPGASSGIQILVYYRGRNGSKPLCYCSTTEGCEI